MLNPNGRTRGESKCDLFCFRECSDKYDTLVHRNQQNYNIEKLSLIKLNSSEIKNSHKMKKSISHNHLQKWHTSTNRSKEERHENKQLQLFRKKTKIEQQIEQVNQQMGHLSIQYQDQIKKLSAVKHELQQLRTTYY